MKAIIFSAGLGTRIQEISKGKPKALVKLNNKTLLEHSVDYLSKNDVTEVIVNIHHQSKMMIDFIQNHNFSLPIRISDESNKLLDTGGGLLKARSFFDDNKDFVVYNVDVLTNLNLHKMLKVHTEKKAIATLAVRKRETSRYLLFDHQERMVGWKNVNTKEQILHDNIDYQQLAFSGIHILSSKIFGLLGQTKDEAFSITKSYIELSKKFLIQGYIHNQDYWFDVGKPESYFQAKDFFE